MNRKFVAKSNFVLRRVLNKKENIEILKEFIEAILNIEICSIELNPYLQKRKDYLPAEENFGIADFRIKTKEEELNIGIQMLDGEHILTKMFLYFAQIHTNQLEYDEERIVAKTITINILDFILTKDIKYHSRMMLRKKETTDIRIDNLEIHILELPKFHMNSNKELTLKDAWINYLKGEYVKKSINKSEKIRKLDELLNKYWKEEVME